MPARTFVSFELDNQLFGIDIMVVREINRHLDLTGVPLSTDFVRGLVNLRGQIVTVLDLKTRLGLSAAKITDVSHNIILKTESDLVEFGTQSDEPLFIPDKASLLVDEIGDVITVDIEEIESPPANIGAIDGKFLSGIIKLDNTLMGIISVTKVLEGEIERVAA